MSHHGCGRIYPYQRKTNDQAEILGEDIDVDEQYMNRVRETEGFKLDLNLLRNYRNRIGHIYKFWEEYFPDYYKNGVRKLSDDESNNPESFHYKNECDLVYTRLNVKMINFFLTSKKVKVNGNMCSVSNLSKYKDAILWGSQEAHSPLPQSFYIEMERFLKSFKKETQKAKKEGKLDEQEADPIPWNLFKAILR